MRKKFLVGLVTVVVGGGFAVATATTSHAADPPPLLPPKVVVLGDSYTAGNGAWNPTTNARAYEDLICWHSPYNYGQQFATAIGATYKNAACSGAVVADLTTPQGGRPAQIDAVDTSADVVVVTIGGNDLGFSTMVSNCFAYPYSTGASCKRTIESAQAKLPALEQNAYAALAAVRAKMRPDARLVYVGYPGLIANSSYVWTVSGQKWDMIPALNTLMNDGEAVQKRIVDKLNSTAPCGSTTSFLSVQSTFAGHGVDLYAWSTSPSEWLIRITTGTYLMESYHPKPAGWGAEATLLTGFYTANLVTTPAIAVAPDSVEQGKTVTVTGHGFRSADHVDVTIAPDVNTTVTADECGAINESIPLGDTTQIGARAVIAASTITGNSASAEFTVTAKPKPKPTPTPTPTPASSPTTGGSGAGGSGSGAEGGILNPSDAVTQWAGGLANTGFASSGIVLAGLGLILAGLALVWARRARMGERRR